MPASERSLAITDAYRQHLVALRDRAGQIATSRWGIVRVEDLDGTHQAWLRDMVAALTVIQQAGVTLTAAYLAAYIASELGGTPQPPAAPPTAGVGEAQHGAPLSEALAATLITVKVALKDGKPADEALSEGASRAERISATAAMSAPRTALADTIRTDPRIVGWRRVTSGGCGACLAAATDITAPDDKPLKVHDNCRCTAEPVIRGTTERAQRASGPHIFAAMSREQQDQALGPETAQLVRDGRVAWTDLIADSPMRVGPDQITQAPIAALT